MNNYYELKQDYDKRRKKDEMGEKIIAEYLDKYFYPSWTTTVTRNTEKETQIQGVDLTATSVKDVEYVIDEKASLYYANKPLKTFAHEITSINRAGKLYNGWLVSKTINNCYVYVWIPECKTTGEITSIDDIIEADVALVKKEDLYNWFRKKNLTGKKLFDKSNELRHVVALGIEEYWSYVSECNNYSLNQNGYKYHISTKSLESSVNILISKDVLMNELATYSVNIKNGILTEIRRK